MGVILLQLAPFLIPEAVNLIKAIAALRQKGVAPDEIAALVKALSDNITALDADTLTTLSTIPSQK